MLDFRHITRPVNCHLITRTRQPIPKNNPFDGELWKVCHMQALLNPHMDTGICNLLRENGHDPYTYFVLPKWGGNPRGATFEHLTTHNVYVQLLPIEIYQEYYEDDMGHHVTEQQARQYIGPRRRDERIVAYMNYRLDSIMEASLS